MRQSLIIFLLLMFTGSILSAQTPSAENILKRIDDNIMIDQAISVTTMIIHGRSGTRSVQSKGYLRNGKDAYVEYLSPPREKGKKMLKLGDKLWTYTPEPVDRVISISGHLLRQSVMGSDLSYEDMMESRSLSETYDAEIIGEEVFKDRTCRVLDLTSKIEGVSYYKRKLWVDVERWLVLKEERYAKSGKLLKKTVTEEVFFIENRWYPRRITFKDMLIRGEGTEYIIDSIEFNANIPDYMFTKAVLRK
ncbi:MAG: outer membrane lipoprotein-sorting protein [Calditrichaeota bacterium]|nr:outer membrane lipoprotein-sorting protein [Calditrichota bacterium]